MNAEQNKKRVIEAWKTFGSRDPERISAVFTDDAEWIAPEGNATAVALKGASHMVGRDAIVGFLTADMHRLFRDIKVEFRGLFGDGDTVILEQQFRAKLPDGKSYDNDYCFLIELEDGRIRQVREYMDTLKGKEIILADAAKA